MRPRIFCLTAGILVLAQSHAAPIPAAEQLLPPDTLLIVSVPDCAKMRDIYDKIPLTQFWNDPAMQPLHDKFMTKWREEFIGSLERDLSVKFDTYASLPQGQLTFALTRQDWNAQDGNVPAALILLDAKGNSGVLKTNLAELRKKWVDAGKPLKTETVRGVEFSIVPLASDSVPQRIKQFFPQRQEIQELGKEPPKPVPSEFVLGQFESLLIAGNSLKAIDKIMARLTGGATACIAEDANFEANRLAVFHDAPVFAWFNAKVFFDVLAKVPPEKPNPQAPAPIPMFATDRVVNGTGLSALKSAAFVFRDQPEGTTTEIFFDAPEATRRGIFKLLALEAKDSNPPPFVPADAVKFQRWRLDGQKAVLALEKMLADISAELVNTYNFLLSNGNEGVRVADPTYDLKRDLFGNLGDDFIAYEKVPRGNSPAELDMPPTLYLIGSPNAEKLLASLKGLLIIPSSQANTPQTREFLGRKIFTIKLPPQQIGDTGKMVDRDLHYSASAGYVALSCDAPMLEEFLRSNETPAKTLRETSGLAEAAQKVGGQSTGLFAYENYSESMRITFETLRRNQAPATNASAINNNNLALNPITSNIPYSGPEKSFREWMDFSLLPPFERVSKYFYFSVHTGNATVDGLSFKFFSPTPPGLKK